MAELPLGRTSVTGRSTTVRVTLTDLPFRQEPAGRRYAYPDFGADFIEALHDRLPGPQRGGFLRNRLVCPGCATPLDNVARQPVTMATEVALQRVPPIQVELELPGMVCPGCGRSLALIHDRSVDSDVSDALIDAFKSAGVVPG